MAQLENSFQDSGDHALRNRATRHAASLNLLTDPKELYDVIEHGGRAGEDNFWVMPAVMKLVAEHSRTLAAEPPIPLGTPDPYRPEKRQ